MRVLPIVLLLLSVALTGCFRGSNVKGDFACKAPGGTCATMSAIDREALAGIGSAAAPLGALRSPGSLPPPQAPLRTVSVAGVDPTTAPARTSERVLRVVFPAHIDRDGIYREEAAAHAVIEPTNWAQALAGPAAEPRRVPALRQGGIAPAVQSTVQSSPAVSGSLLASMDEVVAAQAARRSGAAAAVAPAPAAAAAPTPPYAGATISQFGGVSRAPVPLSLAEAAAALSAPPVARLDPVGPGNYDTPDVTAALTPAHPRSQAAASMSAPAPLPAGAVMRTVRWKGRSYTIAVGGPAATAPAPALTTAELNRQSLSAALKAPPATRADEEQRSLPAAPRPDQPFVPPSAPVEPTVDVGAPAAPIIEGAPRP
jgi:conjugal transfer pilus assembly protein TraV